MQTKPTWEDGISRLSAVATADEGESLESAGVKTNGHREQGNAAAAAPFGEHRRKRYRPSSTSDNGDLPAAVGNAIKPSSCRRSIRTAGAHNGCAGQQGTQPYITVIIPKLVNGLD